MECRKQPEFLFFGKPVLGGIYRDYDRPDGGIRSPQTVKEQHCQRLISHIKVGGASILLRARNRAVFRLEVVQMFAPICTCHGEAIADGSVGGGRPERNETGVSRSDLNGHFDCQKCQ